MTRGESSCWSWSLKVRRKRRKWQWNGGGDVGWFLISMFDKNKFGFFFFCFFFFGFFFYPDMLDEVRGLKIRRDFIAVSLSDATYVYRMEDLKPIGEIKTVDNSQGILAMSGYQTGYDDDHDEEDQTTTNGSTSSSSSSSSMSLKKDKETKDKVNGDGILATLSGTSGHVTVMNLGTRECHSFKAHDGPIQYVALNYDGSLVATASDKGTLIRIFDTRDLELVREIRRGSKRRKQRMKEERERMSR
eukprot:TRINITY_DN1338_c0_g1_i4.p1 TRINITY_DN1338_c0_g1~~TRINITY_DN1338_c0_g1_i4.p1  ORF type:complete len:246 (+),score=32.62 TRINITY_DN1338_c0_g1_i4:262-999(+)